MPGRHDDAALVAKLRARDKDAFTALVRELHGSLVRVALMFVTSRATAEEIAQDTWRNVLASLDQFEGRSSLRTWIFRICTNRAKTLAGREARSSLVVALVLVASVFGCGKEHHRRGADAGGVLTCTGMLYNGDQAGGGDRFAACISHPGIDFSLTVESSSTTTQGMYQSNVAFPNLLLLNSSDPSAGTGTAVEMQSAALLIAPGTLPICVG